MSASNTPPAKFPDDATFEVRDDLVVEQVDDESLVLDLQGNEYFGLNAVARRIWSAIEAEASFAEIVAQICADFDVDRDQVALDVAEFIADGQHQELIRRVDL